MKKAVCFFFGKDTPSFLIFPCTFYAVGSVKKSSSKRRRFLKKTYAIMISSDDTQKATSPHVLGRIFPTMTGFRNAALQKSP